MLEVSAEERKLLRNIIELYGTCKNRVVLDYGCGKGKLIQMILEDTAPPKAIFAADSSQKAIDNIEKSFKDQIKNRLVFPKLLTSPKELAPTRFDAIFCIDVLEAISNKVELILDLYGMLRPRGGLIIANHDFDSIVYNSSKEDLTRKLIHNFADIQQEKLEPVYGQMGRRLPGLFQQAGIRNFNFETMRMFETTFNQGDYGYLMAHVIKEMALDKYDKATLDDWFSDLQEMANNNEYYFAIDFVVVIKVKNE